jgi:peroxiredoxin
MKYLIFLWSALYWLGTTTLGFTPATTNSRAAPSVLAMSSAPTATVKEMEVGDRIASDLVLMELSDPDGKPESVNLSEFCAGKRVVIFGVPGAFTPGCSKSHLPSFMTAYETLTKEHGVDAVICVATNDAYTMEAWGRTSGGTAAGIRFLSDSTGALTRSWGLAMEGPVGLRTKRFSLMVQDNVVTHYFSSAQQSSDTWAPAMLAAL